MKLPIVVLLAVLLPVAAGDADETDPAILQQLEQLNAEAAAAYQRGDFEQGIEAAYRAYDYAERNLGPDDPKVVISINNLAAFYDARGDTARAEPLYQRSLEIREKALGPEHPDVARALNNLAELYRVQGDIARAEPLYRRALEIREKALGPNHPDVARSLNNLAALYDAKGDYVRAEALYQRALTIFENSFGSEHPNVAASLNNLASLYHAKGDYARAELLSQRALGIREKALGPNHPDVAISLNNLAGLYETTGEYARAEPLYQRSLDIWEITFGRTHPNVAAALNNLAGLSYVKGDYTRAESLYQRALAIREKAFRPEHPDLAASLNNLASLYQAKGDYAHAEPLYPRAISILEKALGPDHPHLALSLNNFALLYKAKGDYARAEPLFQRAISIQEKAFGPDHPALAGSLSNLALLYRAKDDTASAEPLLQRALAIDEKIFGPGHPNVATVLNNLGELYNSRGDTARTETLYRRALAIREKSLGPQHPDVASALDNLAVLYQAQGDIPYAVTLQARSIGIEEYHLGLILATGSEAQKGAYARTKAASTNGTLSLHFDAAPQNAEAARLALTTLLQRKGRVLDALTEGIGALRTRLSAEDQAVLDRLVAVRTQLANRVNMGPGKLGPDQYRRQLAQIETEADRLDAELSNRSAEFRARGLPVTLEQVQQALPTESALIELAVYRPFVPTATKQAEEWRPARYAAYVLFPHGELRWVALGEAKPIDRAVEALREALRTPSSRPRSRAARGKVIALSPEAPAGVNPARTLDELVMRPIRKLLGDTRTVFFSPDSALNLIPIGALVDENGHHLIEDYHITYLTSGRDLLRLQVEREAKGSALVLADPDFGVSGSNSKTDAAGERGRRSADLSRGQLRFGPLPGTSQEAKAIAPLLGTQPLTRTRATESALKQVHQPSVLHIATHGFFLPDQQEEPKTRLDPGVDRSRPPPAPRTENPLLRSGLALAGANRLASGSEDGLLTALEASGLDLWGTRLVVLSACETGVGKVQAGEGVYGLRRALVNAGAETQVMSLWKVDDLATRDLMVDYYRRLKTGEGRSEALRQAQLSMLHSQDRSHPYYWASFIVSGDWRELQGNTAAAAGP